MSLTIKQLRHVDALAHSGNFHEAARRLGISQPALTQSIRALERRLGCALFDRLPTGIEPTPLGWQVVSRARQLLPQILELEQEVADSVRSVRGTLSVAAGCYPGYIMVPESFTAVSRQVSDLAIRFTEASWEDFAPLLFSREVELAVGDLGELRDDPRLQTGRLGTDALYYFCAPDHPLARRRRVSLESISEFPVVGNSAPQHIAGLLGRDQRAGLIDEETGVFHPRFQVTTLSAIKRIVASTDAVSLAPLALLEGDLTTGRLVVLDATGPRPSLDTGIAYLAGRALSPLATIFVRELKHQSKNLRARSGHLAHQLGLQQDWGE
jgi:DNA-binding transcriptional LysR family regulator